MWTGVKSAVRRTLPKGIRQAIQWWRLRRLQSDFEKRIVSHRYGEVVLRVELADPLARGWYDHDWTLPPEFALLRGSHLKPGAVVFDIGAHQGIVSLMLGQEVGQAGKVIAVEALPHNAAAAARNRDLNAMPWVEVVSAAISANDGKLLI